MRFAGSRIAAIGALGLVLLAGCGDGDDKASTTSTLPTTSSAPQATTTVPLVTTSTAAPAVATTRPAPPQTAVDPPVTRNCPKMTFNANGEDAAYNVTATGLDCEEAGGFIQAVRDTLNAVGPAEADLEGFHCVRTGTEEMGMPSSDYRCTAGAKKVTFSRS